MEIGLIEIFYIIVYTIIVGLIVLKVSKRSIVKKSEPVDRIVNKLPKELPSLTDSEREMISIYQAEWKTIIETQTHFNDLIIRFRSIVLTVFVTMVGASVALNAEGKINEELFYAILFIILVFWFTSFVLDHYYYHKLLLGSVAQAMKFDQSELGEKYGLFGLTTCISNVVKPPSSRAMIKIFYGLPVLGFLFSFLIWFIFG